MGKIPETKLKRLFYRRAAWTVDGVENARTTDSLENVLKICHTKCRTTHSRSFGGSLGSQMHCAKYQPKDGVGLFFQIVSYVPDQAASAIDKSSATSDNSDVSTVNAPDGKNFLDGDIFLFVNGNDVILLQSGARETVALSYVSQMLEKNAYKREALSLQFLGIAEEDKAKMIQAQGVKSIELNANMYEASLRHMQKQQELAGKEKETKIFDIPGQLTEAFKRLFAEDDMLKEIDEYENVNIKLSISFDGKEARLKKNKNTEGFGTHGKSRLEKASAMLIQESAEDDVDGFTIITGDNNRIKANEIVVSDNFRVKTLGKSLDYNDAFAKLEEYYMQLKQRGTLTR